METKQEYAIQVSDKIESVLMQGDLSKLSANERVEYYRAVCQSVGLNPLTRPFDYITLNGKLTLYAKKDATDQLRANDQVSITKLEKETVNDIYLVTAYASGRNGRTDASTGAVNIAGLKGDALANALMKAETKAKRRVTLSICGMGLLDETEIETIPDARVAVVDEHGEIEQPGTAIMSYADACNVTGSDKKRYGNCTDKELEGKRIGILKALKGDVDAIKQSQYQNKLEAIKVLLSVPEGERLKIAGQPELTDEQAMNDLGFNA